VCRRELEEEASRQRLHFLEEVELLKVQSEERLQDALSQLKVTGGEEEEVTSGKWRLLFRPLSATLHWSIEMTLK